MDDAAYDIGYTIGYYIGFFSFGFLPTFLLSRAFNWILKKFMSSPVFYITGNLMSLLLCGFFLGFSNSQGVFDIILFFEGIMWYAVPQLAWFIWDNNKAENKIPIKKSVNKI